MANSKELLEEVLLDEVLDETGGYKFNKAQCAWMQASCVNYLPIGSYGGGCGGRAACDYYKLYCTK